MSKQIIKGYNGIMDLDLTNVDHKYHQIMIDQHMKDIESYKIEQSKLPIEQRYENTIKHINMKIQYENRMRYLRKKIDD